jgi:Protein of unknown function (DUF3237)
VIAARRTRRRELLDWSLLYLFSFDVELDPDRQENLGKFGQRARINFFSRDDLSRVYNIGRESTIPGNGRPALAGKIISGGDRVDLRNDDVGVCNIRFTLRTDDGAIIDVAYQIFGYLGPGGVARIVNGRGKDKFGTENHPFEVPIVTSPRFQTTAPQYRWINDVQGIGFGRALAIRSVFRRNTQDVYVLT